MKRLGVMGTVVAVLALAGCGDMDLGQAGRSAAWAAVEAANPDVAQGLRAAQTLKHAAAVCGWRDVDAAGLAGAGLAGIEDPAVRAAAASLVQDLIASDAEAPAATPEPAADCSPEARRALEAQIAAIASDGAGADGEAG